MGKIFDVLKAHRISLGEFAGDIDIGDIDIRDISQGVVIKTAPEANTEVIRDFAEVLEIKTLGIENLEEIERQIYAIGIYIMESLGKFIFDSNDIQRRMNSSRIDTKGSEYKVLSKVENGITSNDEDAFRYISIIHQMVYRKDENIKVSYTPLELVATISDPESKGNPILISFAYKEDESQTLEKANKLQVSISDGNEINR